METLGYALSKKSSSYLTNKDSLDMNNLSYFYVCGILIIILPRYAHTELLMFTRLSHNSSSNLAENHSFSSLDNILSPIHCAISCQNEYCRSILYDDKGYICNLADSGAYQYSQLKSVFVKSSSTCDSLSGDASGVYSITVGPDTMTNAYCDMDTLGGGWTVIQNRFDGSQDFYKTWEEYKNGFGNPNSEYWLGNDYIHMITSADTYELRIEMEDAESTKAYASYTAFSLSSESDGYVLTVTGFSGDVFNDRLSHHSGAPFSTKDRDNDNVTLSCSELCHGAWWYIGCYYSNLNGLYNPSNDSKPERMVWKTLTSSSVDYTSLKSSKMMIRPAVP